MSQRESQRRDHQATARREIDDLIQSRAVQAELERRISNAIDAAALKLDEVAMAVFSDKKACQYVVISDSRRERKPGELQVRVPDKQGPRSLNRSEKVQVYKQKLNQLSELCTLLRTLKLDFSELAESRATRYGRETVDDAGMNLLLNIWDGESDESVLADIAQMNGGLRSPSIKQLQDVVLEATGLVKKLEPTVAQVTPRSVPPNVPPDRALLAETDPRAAAFRDGEQWCDVRYASTLDIKSKQIDRARRQKGQPCEGVLKTLFC